MLPQAQYQTMACLQPHMTGIFVGLCLPSQIIGGSLAPCALPPYYAYALMSTHPISDFRYD